MGPAMRSEDPDAGPSRLSGLCAALAVLALPLAGCADMKRALRELAPAAPAGHAVIAEQLPPLPEGGGRLAIRAEPFPLPEAAAAREGALDEAVGESAAVDSVVADLLAAIEAAPADGTPRVQGQPDPAVPEREAQPGTVAPATAGPWVISPAQHGSLRMALEDWAVRAGWHLDWRAREVDFRPSARAEFDGTFLEAVGTLLDSGELGGRLRAEAYAANRWLVVREARP